MLFPVLSVPSQLMTVSTIAAIATPPGQGAVAVIRMSGPSARGIAAEVFRARGGSAEDGDGGEDGGAFSPPPRVQILGNIVASSGGKIDEVLLAFFPGPASYTGEDVVEIACHGGVVVTRAVLARLLEAGAEPAQPGEFSQRAFLNGKMDLTQAEAVMDLISARTELAARAAGQQLAGRLGGELEGMRGDLIALVAQVEAHIDFPDEDIDPATGERLVARLDAVAERTGKLLATADQGRILREGVRTVICGAPNAGKSSLLNLLLGCDRAIVNPGAGTTRDTIEESLSVRGLPLRLVDTAGLREGGSEVEREGIARSRRALEGADLVLHVIDASVATDEGADGKEGAGKIEVPAGVPVLRLLNKSDLPPHPDWEEAEGLRVSCLREEDRTAVEEALFDAVTRGGERFDLENPAAINARHQHCLRRAEEDLARAREALCADASPEFVALELRAALDAVGEVIGRTDVEEILGEIFSTFCVGK